MRTRHPHNFDLRSNLSKKAKQLLRRIAGWPDLNDELRQNAEFLVQVAEDGGQTNLAHAGIQKHRGNFVYERNSIAARCIITHYLREHFGVRITDDRGVTWAVRGGPVPGDREWITHAMSFGTLGAAGKPLAASDTSHQVLSAAHDQDLHRSLKLLIWMSN
ncbi:MAG: hypothetical protein SGJ20_06180, partial [Planctomycetota bacterium]|nr:hypothetical protein [Planctomycetota bacterium]